MKMYHTVTAIFLTFITLGDVMCLTATGESQVNKTVGENVIISWTIQNMERALLAIYSNNASDENEIFTFNVKDKTVSRVKTVGGKLTGTYEYLVKVDGIETGKVNLTVTNLTLKDNGIFIIEDFNKELTRTKLSVISPVMPTGSGLSEDYNSRGEELTISISLLGNPQPVVTWALDGVPLQKSEISNPSPHNYTYTVKIDKEMLPKPCHTKELNYTATNYGGTVKGSTRISERPNAESTDNFFENIIVSKSENCTNITWNKREDTGKCGILYEVKLFDSEEAMIFRKNITTTSFQICNSSGILNLTKSFRITRYIYGGLNDAKEAWVEKATSAVQKFEITKDEVPKAVKKDESKFFSTSVIVAIAIGGSIIVLLLFIIVVVCCVKKRDQVKSMDVTIEDSSATAKLTKDDEALQVLMYSEPAESTNNNEDIAAGSSTEPDQNLVGVPNGSETSSAIATNSLTTC